MAISKTNEEVQTIFLNFMLSNPTLYTRVQNIYNPENFTNRLKPAARFLKEHVAKFNGIPTPEQINAVSGVHLELVQGVLTSHEAWFLEEFEKFTRMEELERAILKSADLLAKGEFDPVEKLIKDAVQISLTRDLGIDYFHEPKTRLMRLKNNNGQVSTGWKDIDAKLYGGVNYGELQIFCGQLGTGKSLFLQNLALNWMEAGLNGIYISFELSADLVAMRIDSMITGFCSKEIFKNIDDVELKVVMAGKKCGRLKIKYLSSGSTTNQIRAYIKELIVQENFKLDFVCLDYIDLIMPSSVKVDPSDTFTKDKFVCEELRNYFMEIRTLGASASQLNRSSYEELEFSPSNVAGGISKLNTADNVFAIFTSRIMKERGNIQLQFMKTRNSAGVGSKVDLDFDNDSLRITDSASGSSSSPIVTGSTVLAKLRSGSGKVVTPPIEGKKNMLNDLLGKIQNGNKL